MLGCFLFYNEITIQLWIPYPQYIVYLKSGCINNNIAITSKILDNIVNAKIIVLVNYMILFQYVNI